MEEVGYDFWYPSPFFSKLFFWFPKAVHWAVLLSPVAILAAVFLLVGPAFAAVSSAGAVLYLYFNVLTKSALTPRVTKVNDSPSGKKKRVAVIGAGPAGLVTAKELFLKGHDVLCYDRQQAVGGVFAHKFWHAGQLTSSPYITCYSDYEPQRFEGKQRHRHWFKEEYCFYLENYVRRFGFGSCLRLGHEVVEVKKVYEAGMDEPLFYLRALCDGKIVEDGPFHHIAICNGSFDGEPNIPNTPGLKEFPGEVYHTSKFNDVATFKKVSGKRVVTVGLGESMADLLGAIMELPKPPSACTASVRSGAFTIPRINPLNNLSNDFDSTRLRYALPKTLHNLSFVVCSYLTAWFRWEPCAKNRVRFNMFRQIPHGAPAYRPASKSGAWIPLAAEGKIKMRGGLDRIEGKTVYFTDGSKMEDVDVLVFGSGFKPRHFPFFNEKSFPEGRCAPTTVAIERLYRIFDPDHGDSIGFIGLGIRPLIGTIPTICEIQARLFSMVVSGERELPPREELVKIVAKAEAKAKKESGNTYGCGYKMSVNWIPFMDSVANEIGCLPPLSYLLARPKIALKLLIGPMVAFHYRLAGPDADPEVAEDAIFNLPFGTRPVDILFFAGIHASVALLSWPVFLPKLLFALLSPKFWADRRATKATSKAMKRTASNELFNPGKAIRFNSVEGNTTIAVMDGELTDEALKTKEINFVEASECKELGLGDAEFLDNFLSVPAFAKNMSNALMRRTKSLSAATEVESTMALRDFVAEVVFAANVETLVGEGVYSKSFYNDYVSMTESSGEEQEAAKKRMIAVLRTARKSENSHPIFGQIQSEMKTADDNTDQAALLLLWRASVDLLPSAEWLIACLMKDEKSLWALRVERAKCGSKDLVSGRPLLSAAVAESIRILSRLNVYGVATSDCTVADSVGIRSGERVLLFPSVSLTRSTNIYPAPNSFKPYERFGTQPRTEVSISGIGGSTKSLSQLGSSGDLSSIGHMSRADSMASFHEDLDQSSYRKMFNIFEDDGEEEKKVPKADEKAAAAAAAEEEATDRAEISYPGKNFSMMVLNSFVDAVLLAPAEAGASFSLEDKDVPLPDMAKNESAGDIMMKIVKV